MRLVPFHTHGRIELASGPVVVALPLLTGALQEPKARAFFGVALGPRATVCTLTDWDADPEH